ncbi:Transposable element Tcb1 transposase, partial [Stegodyphus mimosarum]
MSVQVYRDDILGVYVRPYARAISDDFLLQDDNTRLHRIRIVDDYLQQQTIQRLEKSARSPDLNPIKHVWDALGRHIAALNPPVQTLVHACNCFAREVALTSYKTARLRNLQHHTLLYVLYCF